MARRATVQPPPVSDGFPLPLHVWSRVASEMRLSQKQTEIVELLLRGYQFKHVPEILGISPSTVKTQVERIYHRTGVSDQAELLIRIMAVSHRLADHVSCPPQSRHG